MPTKPLLFLFLFLSSAAFAQETPNPATIPVSQRGMEKRHAYHHKMAVLSLVHRESGSVRSFVVDSATAGKGFACLKFEMAGPQYYRYNYVGVSGATFSAVAEGDLNGDGTTSLFHQDGSILSGALLVAPSIVEVNPEE